jgi:hypothetical protein
VLSKRWNVSAPEIGMNCENQVFLLMWDVSAYREGKKRGGALTTDDWHEDREHEHKHNKRVCIGGWGVQ